MFTNLSSQPFPYRRYTMGVRFGFAFILLAGLVSCSPESPKLEQWKPPSEKVEDARKAAFNVTPRVDILFVVDDSGSMHEHQENLAANIQQFVRAISRAKIIDYHIGVTTTSDESYSSVAAGGKLNGTPRFIERSTPFGLIKLRKNLVVGTSGSASEKMFTPLKMALTPPVLDGWNKGFYRADAFLVPVFVTDAEDQSDDLNASELVTFLSTLKGGQSEMIFPLAAYVPSRATGCGRDDPTPPTRLEEFFTLTSAFTFSLCDKGFGRKLAQAAEELVRRVTTVLLKRPPDPETLLVTYGGVELERNARTGWAYNPARNSIEFGAEIQWDALPREGKLEISFDEAPYTRD